jgi:hypothetical protein
MSAAHLHKTLLSFDILLTNICPSPKYSFACALLGIGLRIEYGALGASGLSLWAVDCAPSSRRSSWVGFHALRIPAQGDTGDCSAPLILS